MKNVTGLDLVKLNCGAHGTLGLVTQATFKLLPKPECEASIVIRRLDDRRAIEALSAALGSPFGVSGAAHISAGMGREFPRTLVRVEGFRESVDYRVAALLACWRRLARSTPSRATISQRLWRAIRDATFIASPSEHAIWRISLAPSRAADFVARVGARAHAHFSTGAAVSSGWRRSPAADGRRDPRGARAVRRPRHAGSRAGLAARAASTCSSRFPRRSMRITQGRQGRASIRTACSIRGGCTRGCETRCKPISPPHSSPTRISGVGENPALLRPLRLLHRDLPDLCAGGDERDSPRGRIYLIKDLLETGRAPTEEDVKPIDHCLSCLSCMTTCPSGVD